MILKLYEVRACKQLTIGTWALMRAHESHIKVAPRGLMPPI